MQVLIAEDDGISRYMLENDLKKWGYGTVAVSDGRQVLDTMSGDDAPQILILDWVMPKINGLELCRKLQNRKSERPLYIILLTGKSDNADVVKGLEAGADDYMVKPYVSEELRARLNAGVRIIELQEALAYSARYDYLTGTCNRRSIIDHLDRELARARRSKTFLSVAMIDIDRFKQVNDNYGHMAGDDVLQSLVELLRAYVREYDYIGRFGGEEFILVLPGSRLMDRKPCFERLREAVQQHPLKTRQGDVGITVSIGVVFSDGSMNVDKIIQSADEALYLAKDGGRNRVEYRNLLSPELFRYSETS